MFILLYLPLSYKMLTHGLLAGGLMIYFEGTPGLLYATGNGLFCYTCLFIKKC